MEKTRWEWEEALLVVVCVIFWILGFGVFLLQYGLANVLEQNNT
jgi:hypothetical protein